MSMSRNGSFPSRSTSEVKVILGCCWLRYLRKRGTWFRDRKRTTYLRTTYLFISNISTNMHPNITFISEVERDGKLPFLDIVISRSQGKFNTFVYRKPTFTGLFANFHSFIPLTYKRCLVFCLIHRIFNLCSSYENFHTQLEVVRNLLKLNGFPSHMFECITRRFLDNTFDPKPSVQTVPKKIIYFCLPFPGIHSLQICTQINRLCNAAFSHLDTRFVFRSSGRIASFFPFKDKVPKYLRSSVVYLFKCRCCSASYVGQTTRHLYTRISEHLGISLITGKHTANPAKSSVLSYSCASGHKVVFDNFKILSSCSDSYELMIRKTLLINKYKPTLNVEGSSIPLDLSSSTVFVCKCPRCLNCITCPILS